jgi:hypothetical protein
VTHPVTKKERSHEVRQMSFLVLPVRRHTSADLVPVPEPPPLSTGTGTGRPSSQALARYYLKYFVNIISYFVTTQR